VAAIDNTPIPEDTLGFELPDSDAYMYGLGFQYKKSDRLTMGISYMYYQTTSRTVSNLPVAGLPGIDGEFSDGGAHAVTVGVITSF
jgi:long-chain fatty acid transport protein